MADRVSKIRTPEEAADSLRTRLEDLMGWIDIEMELPLGERAPFGRLHQMVGYWLGEFRTRARDRARELDADLAAAFLGDEA